jgi:very-short-patch-repair endonuclease
VEVVEKECQSCSRTFSRPTGDHRIGDALWEARRYCSRACASKGYSDAARAARPSKPCAICGEEFSAPQNRLDRLATCGKEECKRQYATEVMGRRVSERMVADYASGNRTPARGLSVREEALWPFLEGSAWMRRVRWSDANGRTEMDFADFGRRINVEIDGAEHAVARRRTADEERDAELVRLGWTIYRFTNDEVDADAAGVAARILAL